jgi:ATP-dependent RNA helicase DeaD
MEPTDTYTAPPPEDLLDEEPEETVPEVIDDESLTFEDLVPDPGILEAIRRLGFSQPTPVQRRAIPEAMTGRDIIIQARTGSGKTYAFVIPLLTLLQRAEERGEIRSLFGLMIVPTRELAIQIKEAIESLSTKYRPTCVIGGANMEAQINDIRQDPRIVVGTPGRLLDLMRQKVIKLNQCQYFVLDEADEILSSGFLEDVRAILSRLPDRRQGIFSSATITPRVDMLANSFLTKPRQIIIDVAEKDLPAVEHYFCDIPGDLMAKPNMLCDVIETWRPKSAVIFCNTKSDTQMVEALLRRRGFDARRLNSDLSQGQRNRVMRKIRDGELQFLIATDIAARGIDIAQLEMVVNYSIHEQAEIYIHRTGRTGRAGRGGKALSLVGPKDFGSFHFLRKVLNLDFRQAPAPSDEDVANARLAHLYQMIRGLQGDLSARDQLVATKFIRELIPGIEEIPEDFQAMVAKLIRHIMEHHVRAESQSLDEEFGEAQEGEPFEGRERERRDGGDSRRDRDERRGRRDDEREGRGERRRRDRDEREPRRGREDRRDSHREGRREDREGREERHRRDDRPPEREESPRGEKREPRPREQEQQVPFEGEVRLYVGQGRKHGMTEELFADLAAEFASVPKSALKRLSIRELYGFVDVPSDVAPALIESLNGIEYNGLELPVEQALQIPPEEQRRPPRRERSGDDNRRHDRRRDSRRERGRRDRREY